MPKSSADELAVFGGAPAFEEKLHVGRPNIGDRARLFARLEDILDERWLTNRGPYVQEFERRLASLLGVKHCVAMCNATVGLEITIRALGLAGEVIVPSFTFIATAHALQWQGITPVFCDVDPATHNLDPRCVEELITPRTTGILGVHLWGRACEVEALAEIARRRKLRVLYDAAHAFGCSHNGRMIGGFGDAEVFSFHATKFFNTFEGGAVTTDNDRLAERLRLMKNFGFSDYDYVSLAGTNGKMTEVAAAMGLTSLESLDEFIALNRSNYEEYWRQLAGLPGVELIRYDEAERQNYQYVVLDIDEEVTRLSRDELMHVLRAENVLARRYFYPGCHRMQPYCSSHPRAGLRLPETERLAARLLILPTGTAMRRDDVEKLCALLRLVVADGERIARSLRAVAPEAAVTSAPLSTAWSEGD